MTAPEVEPPVPFGLQTSVLGFAAALGFQGFAPGLLVDLDDGRDKLSESPLPGKVADLIPRCLRVGGVRDVKDELVFHSSAQGLAALGVRLRVVLGFKASRQLDFVFGLVVVGMGGGGGSSWMGVMIRWMTGG